MNRSSAVLGLAALAIAGVLAYKRYERNQISPFALWEIRAGMPIKELDDQAYRGEHKHFKCRDIEAGVQLCEIPTDGPIGVMRLAVDSTGHAMIVQFRVADTTLKMVDESRKLAAVWSLADEHHVLLHDKGGAAYTRWSSQDSAWTATIANGASSPIPSMIELVDERRLARTLTESAPVLLRLAQAGFVDASAVDDALARSEPDLAAAARTLGTAGRTRSLAAAALPACARVSGDTIVASAAFRSDLGKDATDVLEQAVAHAYPGLKLRLADRAYLVDATGGAEEVRLVPATNQDGDYAFALTFPRRVSAVHRRIEIFYGDTAGSCRAAAQILVAHRDSATGQVSGISAHDVDEEALASVVMTLDFASDENGRPALVTRYTATYGMERWLGEVEWNALITPHADSLRVARRIPTVVGKKDADQHESSAMLIVEKESAAGLHLSLIRMEAGVPFTRLLLPPGPHGLASGWVLLDLL